MDGQGTECLKLFYNLRETGKGGDSFLAIQKSQMPDDSWTLFSTRLDFNASLVTDTGRKGRFMSDWLMENSYGQKELPLGIYQALMEPRFT